MTNVEYNLKLDEIPDYEYTGYIWKSDASKPEILNGQTFDFTKIEENPFIIEGYLYFKKDNLSISIKQIDGQYIISKVNLKGLNFESNNFTTHKYLTKPVISKQKPKPKPEFKYIKFVQFWEEKEDELCENMKVLKPAWVAFVGFENGGKNEPQK